MAQVLLLSATAPDDHKPEHQAPLVGLRESAARDRFGVHSLTADPEAADVILFAESYGAGWHFERVRRHPFTKRFREKCFIFNSSPFVIPFLPGIYTGIGRRWSSSRTVCGFYIGKPRNDFTTFTPATDAAPHLYSFMGSTATATVRRQLAGLQHPRGFFHDTAADYTRALHGQMIPEEQQQYERRYADISRSSKFVLCPRGLSVSTIRVFETMRMGRVPVILSDDWIEPPGPAWNRFAIRVPEADWAEIPRILEEREQQAVEMGNRAHQEWANWFSDEAAFHRAVDWCIELKQRRKVPESLARWPVYLQYLRPFHFRRAVRSLLQRARSQTALRPSRFSKADAPREVTRRPD